MQIKSLLCELTMNNSILKSIYCIAISLIFLGFTWPSSASEKNTYLPAGWSILPKEKSTKDGNVEIEGFFSGSTIKAKAILVENKATNTFGLAVVTRPNQIAMIVKTFKDIVANPPSLSVIKPGKYHPTCLPEVKKCSAITVKNQAIGLTFEEASGQIIYFDKNKFKVVHVTD
jgi:hypothetical protein